MSEMKVWSWCVCYWISSCGQNCTHWLSLVLPKHLFRSNLRTVIWWLIHFIHGDRSMCKMWVTSTGADFYEYHARSCLLLVKMINQGWRMCRKIMFSCLNLALFNSVLVLLTSLTVSMEINRYFFQTVSCI